MDAEYRINLPLEYIDRKLRLSGYETVNNIFAGCFYKKDIYTIEVVFDEGDFVISHPNKVNGTPHPFRILCLSESCS